MDGKLVPWRDAKVHVLTHTLHYGMGVFEGVRAYEMEGGGTGIFRLQEHTARLFESAHILNIQIPWEQEVVSEAQCQVVRENNLEHAYIRPLVFLGSEALGLRVTDLTVHIMVAAWAWPSYMDPEALRHGIRMRTSSYTRHHVNITMCKSKSIANYTNSILALREAVSGGAEEALLLDNEGYVAEGSGENVFVVRGNVVHTPELTSCLDGITRRTVLQFLSDMGVEVRERRITRDEIYIADEVFLTGTAAEVVPVNELDGRKIGTGVRGHLTEKIQTLYFEQVHGQRDVYPEWQTRV